MSPDIHWGVGDDAEQETIAQSMPTRRSRRSWVAILIVVILGVGLGMAYRSLPEAAPRPTPTLSPTPAAVATHGAIPAALYQSIDREAQALADGDFEANLEIYPPSAWSELAGQRPNFTAWGRPRNGSPLYAIVDFDLLTDSSAWADVRQFRDGRYFRETRFYPHADEHWLRSLQPDLSLWSGREENLQTPHFNVTYAVEDRDLISPTLRQLEEDYQALCRDLDCTLLGHALTFTLQMKASAKPYYPMMREGGNALRLPSPRVTGFFESGRAYSWRNSTVHALVAAALAEPIYGPLEFDRPGSIILWAGIVWAIDRIDPLPAEIRSELGDLKQKSLVPLEKLWNVPQSRDSQPLLLQAFQLMRFIEQTYGASAVAQLLGTVNSAKSLSDAIEHGLGVPFTGFDQRWQTWAKQNIAKQ